MTKEMWELMMQREAREWGYRLAFVSSADHTAALFFNGPIFCYARVWGEAPQPKESQDVD